MKNFISLILCFGLLLILIPSLALTKSKSNNSTHIISTTNSNFHAPKKYKFLIEKTGEIIEVPLKDYLIGSVFAQLPADFEKEAIKAQILIAHTYILKQHLMQKENPSPNLKGADFSDNSAKCYAWYNKAQAKKLYGNKFDEKLSKISKIVDEVIDYVITYDDKLILTAFHSISSGITDSAKDVWKDNIPYLQSTQSVWDQSESEFSETKEFTTDELKARLITNIDNVTLKDDTSNWIKIKETTNTGTVLKLDIGNKEITGEELSNILSLRSSCFDISYKDNKFFITTKGIGHNVGLSQYGANTLAKQGKNFENILKYYYKNIEITKV